MKNALQKNNTQREHLSAGKREHVSVGKREHVSVGKIPYKKFIPRNMENSFQFLENKLFLDRSQRAASIREGIVPKKFEKGFQIL